MSQQGADADRARLAREGRVEPLFDLARQSPQAAYLWLLVAQDFGSNEAEGRLADLEEAFDDFKYDDDGRERMGVRLQLGWAYLKGELGLERDLERGRQHLQEYLNLAAGSVEGDGQQTLRALSAEVADDARRVVEACLDDQPFRAVQVRIERLKQLRAINREGAQVPTVILEGEAERLRQEVEHAIKALFDSGR